MIGAAAYIECSAKTQQVNNCLLGITPLSLVVIAHCKAFLTSIVDIIS